MKENQNTTPDKLRRGFSAMDSEKQKAVASRGGRSAHEQGVAHQWTPDEAREAGRKGGLSRKKGRIEDNPPLL
jgi:general stress protein YciG